MQVLAAIFSCKFLIDVDVAGIVCDGLWIGRLAKNCIHIQGLNLCGVFDKDMTFMYCSKVVPAEAVAVGGS